jgi:uncharacterized protein (DUF305 family)
METNSLILAIMTAAALALSGMAADEKKHEGHHASSPMAAMIAPKTGAEFEAAYLGMMIHHHEGGVKMAQLAVEKATSEELKGMMQKAAAKQRSEIQQMTGWLKEWHKKSPADFEEPKESKEKMKMDMAEVQAAKGKEFDPVFSKKMAEHHMGAIEMGHLAHQKAQHDEVKSSGAKIAEDQEKERKQLLAIAEKSTSVK